MNATTLRDILRRQPFEPFRIVRSNGETFDIRHPEMAMVMQHNLVIGYEESEEGFPARMHVASLLHIAHLHPLDSVSS